MLFSPSLAIQHFASEYEDPSFPCLEAQMFVTAGAWEFIALLFLAIP